MIKREEGFVRTPVSKPNFKMPATYVDSNIIKILMLARLLQEQY
jgi:hypothetical protein